MTDQGHYGNPWSTPADSAGDEMQTDVMRFMAILGLCLVAIFALVQSLPLAPAPIPEPLAATEVRSPALPQADRRVPPAHPSPGEPDRSLQPMISGEEPFVLARAPATAILSDAKDLPPAPEALGAELSEEHAVSPAMAPPPSDLPALEEDSEGFTLRFESDQALRVLVARGEVQFFGVSAGKAWRLASGDQLAFVATSPPGSFHEMNRDTIPASVLRAFRRQVPVPSNEASWGVTLPEPMRASVQSMLQRYRGGELIILDDGSVRREPRQSVAQQ